MPETPLNALLIEDQLDIQMILKLTLEKSTHFKVATAASGADGLGKAATNKPDLIILDFSLPDMEAPDIMAALRANAATSSIPIIMLTARTGGLSIEDCKKNGALDVLFKPFDPRIIADQILKLYQASRA